MNDEHKAELARKPEFLASHNGFTVHEHPGLANGWIELHDDSGNIIACVNNVKAIYIAPRRRPSSD